MHFERLQVILPMAAMRAGMAMFDWNARDQTPWAAHGSRVLTSAGGEDFGPTGQRQMRSACGTQLNAAVKIACIRRLFKCLA